MNKEPEKTNEHLHHFAVHQKLTQHLKQLYFNKKKMLKGFCKLYRAWGYYMTLLNKVLYEELLKLLNLICKH